MLFKVSCYECNATLYESPEFKPLDTILEAIGFQCPRCNRKIPNPIKPVQILYNGKEIKPENTPKPTVKLRQKQKWWRKEVKK